VTDERDVAITIEVEDAVPAGQEAGCVMGWEVGVGCPWPSADDDYVHGRFSSLLEAIRMMTRIDRLGLALARTCSGHNL
jgi:hypothetical protein